MEIDFLKMRGCGDDVVLLDGTRLPAEAASQLPRLSRHMLDRSRGVGGTTLVVLGAAEGSTLAVRFHDPQGMEAGLPCNAARCAARYASDSGVVNVNEFLLDGGTRKARAQIIDSANVRVDVGSPVNLETSTEMRESLADSYTRSLRAAGRSVTYTPVSIGRSYGIIFVSGFSFPLRQTGREVAASAEFPQVTGVGFVQVCSRDELRLRTWEPPGQPQADECAAAAAALVAAVVNGLADREAFVRLRQGDLFVQWDESDNRLRVTGPALYVFTGTYDYEPARQE